MMVRVIIGAPIRIATLAQAMYASPPHGLHHKRPVRTIKLVPRLGDFDRLEVKILTGANSIAGWARLLEEGAAQCCEPHPVYDE